MLVLQAGSTSTAAWGSISQWDEQFQPVRSVTRALGLGPLILVRCQPIQTKRVSLSLDLLGAFVFYSARFPPGGDFYNFSWRLGGSILIRATDRLSITLGVRWMHVSNGQRLGPHNPSYEAVGFPIGLSYGF